MPGCGSLQLWTNVCTDVVVDDFSKKVEGGKESSNKSRSVNSLYLNFQSRKEQFKVLFLYSCVYASFPFVVNR